jgi:hypothetical protein
MLRFARGNDFTAFYAREEKVTEGTYYTDLS